MANDSLYEVEEGKIDFKQEIICKNLHYEISFLHSIIQRLDFTGHAVQGMGEKQRDGRAVCSE